MSVAIWLKLLHVAVAMLFIAGLFGRAAAFGRARQARDIQIAATLLHLSDWFERVLVIPCYLAVIVTGIVTASVAGWQC